MKQHSHCTDPEQVSAILSHPAVPEELRTEYRRLALAWAALAALLPRGARADVTEAPRFPNFAPRATRAISLFMSGGPPQQDLASTSATTTPRSSTAWGSTTSG